MDIFLVNKHHCSLDILLSICQTLELRICDALGIVGFVKCSWLYKWMAVLLFSYQFRPSFNSDSLSLAYSYSSNTPIHLHIRSNL